MNQKPKDWVDWQGLGDGPWPSVFVNGDLEVAEAEWLCANNLGAYSMSTVALMHTRRQHGLLVSHLAEDFRRHVVLSHLEMTLEVAGRSHSLSTHQFPNMAPTLGYRALESFSQDPLPRWVYRFPTGTIERTVSLVHNRQAVVIALTWSGRETARLSLRPLMPMRPAEDLCDEQASMLQKVSLRSGEVEVQPVSHLPPVLFQHEGVFMGFPDWWRRFEYLDDRDRYEEFQEDMWSPGVFELRMEPRKTMYLVVSVGGVPDGSPQELVLEAAQRRLEVDPRFGQVGSGQKEAVHISTEVRALCVASENFVFAEGAAIIAGYPWLDVWARDTLLALPGIFLVRGDIERAKRSIRHLLRNTVDGFLVGCTTLKEDKPRPCVESSLWIFQVACRLIDSSRDDETFCDEVYECLTGIYARFCEERQEFCWLTREGLLVNSAHYPLTWMSSVYNEKQFTPRSGLAVEFQALWFKACKLLSHEADRRGATLLAADADSRARLARESFKKLFWCHETNHSFDCMSELRDSADAWADPSVRPNALICLSTAPELFEPWQVSEILTCVEERLLTARGVRTLDPAHPEYIGHAGKSIAERAAASHQGTAWPHLLLFYVRAKLRQNPESRLQLLQLIQKVLQGGRALGHVAHSADGDPPHRQWGIPASAMSTGMLLEALVVDLGEALR